ncbi:hypothetical protein Tco_0289671, partial [Tanacetum coccineum]
GADDEEIPEGGIPRVIVLGYDGLPIQPVAPPSPDYIPGPEDPQTPLVPPNEDEREPMFVQAHDPDYVPEPIYTKYIPLEDEHEFLAEEQPLPPVDSPTAESPGYITESDPEEDPEECEDDEIEDGLADYPIDGGDDGDDDDGDSSRDDTDKDEDDEDEDDEDKEEEHLAPADSTIIVPVDEPTSISLLPEAEVDRLLAMTTPSPSPPVSLSPPSAGERLARFTAALPSPTLPPLPLSLYIPPPVDHRDEIPESEQPPHKRLCLSTLGSRYEIGESSTGIRDVRYGIRDTWVDPAKAVPEIAPVTLGEVNTRVIELVELHEHDTHELYALLKDAQDSRRQYGWWRRRSMLLDRIETGDLIRSFRPIVIHVLCTYTTLRPTRHTTAVKLLARVESSEESRQPQEPEAGIPDSLRMLLGTDDPTVSNLGLCAGFGLGEGQYKNLSPANPRRWMRLLSWPMKLMVQNPAPTLNAKQSDNKRNGWRKEAYVDPCQMHQVPSSTTMARARRDAPRRAMGQLPKEMVVLSVEHQDISREIVLKLKHKRLSKWELLKLGFMQKVNAGKEGKCIREIKIVM